MKSSRENVGFPHIRLISDWPENCWKPLDAAFTTSKSSENVLIEKMHIGNKARFHLIAKRDNGYENTGYYGV